MPWRQPARCILLQSSTQFERVQKDEIIADPPTPDRNDTPAVALGPTASFLGAISALGAWPALVSATLPWVILAGALAVTFGLAGIHCASRGIGHLWIATAGVILGTIGLVSTIAFIGAYSA